ncbi:MAG: hypothetical protein ACXVA6_15735 [Isosphaeraceae bacterium]
MAGDIKLDGDWIVVEGNWTRIRTLDLMLDAPSRRITQSGQRRALVHDNTDRLTINYASDYPNGVYISGQTSIEALYVGQKGRFANGVVTPSLLLSQPSAPEEFQPGKPPPGGSEYGLDVGAAISQLGDEIAQLKARVDALEHP